MMMMLDQGNSEMQMLDEFEDEEGLEESGEVIGDDLPMSEPLENNPESVTTP